MARTPRFHLHLRGSRARAALAICTTLSLAVGALACNAIIGTRDDLTYDPNAGGGDGSAGNGDGNVLGQKDGGNGAQDGAGGQDGGMVTCPGIDVLTSLANCGACAHDCTGGACAAGICTLSDKAQAGIGGLDVSGTDVYAAAGDGTLGRCVKNGCLGAGLTFVVSSNELELERVHLVGSNVFFSNYYDNSTFPTGVYQVTPSVDAGITRLTPLGLTNVDEFNVFADAGTLFFGTDSDPGKGFYSCKLGNCDAGTSIESAAQAYDSLFLPNGAFVWSTDTGIHYCASPQNCAANTIIFDGDKGNGGWVSALAYDASTDTLFFTTAHYLPDKYPDKLQSCPAKDLACVPSTYVGGLRDPRGVTAGSGVVYWTEAGTTSGKFPDGGVPMDGTVNGCTVKSGACTGGARVIAKGLSAPNRITMDAKSIYWTNEGLVFNFGTYGQLQKAPR